MTTLVGCQLVWEAGGSMIIDHVDIDVAPGEIVALVGPNGSGKSSLVRLLAGDTSPAKGHVEIDGKRLDQLSRKQLALCRAVMPQSSTLGFGFTVGQVVEMGCTPHQPHGACGPASDVLADVGISHLQHRLFRTLSGGEQALATLARVLAQRTPALLLDEPTASLDLAHQERVMKVTRAVADRGGTVILVAHDLNLAAAYSDRICVLHEGRRVAFGDPWAVLEEPMLAAVFGHEVAVTVNPVDGSPLVVPRRANLRSAEVIHP